MELPTTFGKYELLERIATGGMAEVFLARSFGVAGFEKRLVIKRIRPELAQDPRFVSMFINEAKISVYLDHPNIVQVYDLGKVGQTHFIAMEHLYGRDLTRLVKTLRARGDGLPLSVSVAITAEVCRGLAYAHGRTDVNGLPLGLVHRDVSPHNVLVTFAGEVKLVDFGIARLMNTAQGQTAAPGRPGGGKYAYMSPEQARGEDIDHRSDVFSTGILLWELIANHRLFDHPDPAEKLRLVQEAVIPDPRDEGKELDDELWAVLHRALAQQRDDRYPTAAELEEDLRAWLFRRGLRIGSPEIAAVMADAFPERAAGAPGDLDLRRLVADVERMDATQPTLSVTPARTAGSSGNTTRTNLPGIGPAVGERKNVVVLVVDVDGLTDLSARLEPEDLFHHHFQVLRWMRRVVDRYTGIVHRAVDDQVLILFGVPRTRHDDVERALSCALELQRSAKDLQAKGLSLELAIGAHHGEVTVSKLRKQLKYVARGDTTRLARRLSSLADHGQVVISPRLLPATEMLFRVVRGPDLPNRGGRDPSPTYVVQSRRSGVRVRESGLWIRRGSELEVLRDALLGLASGQGTGVVLTGRMGVGKSRLVREILHLARRRGLPMYTARCAAYGEEVPLEPLREVVRQVLSLRPDERVDPELTTVRLTQLGLAEHDADVLADLLSSAPPPADEAWRAGRELLYQLSGEGPLIVSLDDVQHLRPEEHRQLRKLLQGARQRPLLFLLTWQGELSPVLEPVTVEIRLEPFSREEQQRLVQNLLGVKDVDHALCTVIERSCEGNPLYIEEMVKYLLSRRRIEVQERRAVVVAPIDALELPVSLAGVLAARIDALDPASKGVLQLASLIGSVFSSTLLGAAAGVDDPTPLVSDLAAHRLIHRAGHDDSEQWAFTSDLVRRTAARGILGVQQRDYHRLIATAMEELVDLDTKAEVLAHHCAEGGRLLDAARYAYRAGQVLERGQFLERARDAYARGIQWITSAEASPETWDARTQGEAMLQHSFGAVSLLLSDVARGERALHLALDIASDAGLPWIEARVHLALGRSYMHRSRMTLAKAHVDQAKALLRLERDPELDLEAAETAATVAYESGRNDEAEAAWREALDLAVEPTDRARCLVGLANLEYRAGLHEEPAAKLQEALLAARLAGDRILEGRVLNNLGLLHHAHGRTDQALASFREALAVREGVGYARGVIINHHNLGDVHLARGDLPRAQVAFSRSHALALDMGWERGVLVNAVYLGYLEALLGDEVGGLERIARATHRAEGLGDVEVTARGEWLEGRWWLHAGETERGRHLIQAAAERAEAAGHTGLAHEVRETLAP